MNVQGPCGRQCDGAMHAAGRLVLGYAEMVDRYIGNGWMSYLMTFMFVPLRGSAASVMSQMADEVERVYSIFVTRIIRNPRSPKAVGRLPIFLAAPDLPVPKRRKQSTSYIDLNGGRHWHARVLIPPNSRLQGDAVTHFAKHRNLYVNDKSRLINLHIQPDVRCSGYVTGYSFKAIARGRFSSDEILVLPRTLSELSEIPPRTQNVAYSTDLPTLPGGSQNDILCRFSR
jgi:hypothetical protein